jgi:hypothetical protein
MSYQELDFIKGQGIDSIVNLCGEFVDLHEIEEKYGFDVYYLPLADETAPDMEEMERCLEWIDEALFLGKKVLVHCHHGIGRTGTVITAYLLRRGLDIKPASALLKMKETRANPANYAQWRLVRKYGKAQGRLTVREPSLESGKAVDLTMFFSRYEALFAEIEEKVSEYEKKGGDILRCGLDTDACCHSPFTLSFFECVYMMHHINRTLRNVERKRVREEAARGSALVRNSVVRSGKGHELFAVSSTYRQERLVCPLSHEGRCLLYQHRPLRCRYAGLPQGTVDTALFNQIMDNISRELFLSLTGAFPEEAGMEFSSLDALSGKFMEEYFAIIARQQTREGAPNQIF